MFRTAPLFQIRILRIWVEGRENGRKTVHLRFSLENPETGERRSARDIESLVSYLEADIRQAFRNDGDNAQD